MDYNYTELNPVVFLTVFYKDKDKYVEIGVIITRKLNLHKLREKIKELTLGTIFNCKLEENHSAEKYNNWLDHKEFPCIESEFISLFIPCEGGWGTALHLAVILRCGKYILSKPALDCKELFNEVERNSLIQLQLNHQCNEIPLKQPVKHMDFNDKTVNPKEKLVEINLFSYDSNALGTLRCFESGKELYESKLKMYTDARVSVNDPVESNTYQLGSDQGVFTHRCVNNPAIFIAKPFSTPPFPLEVNTVIVPTIGSVRKLLDEPSGNVKLSTITVKSEPIVDVEEDLKTVEKILAKYELKLTAEQKCKFLEELVKVLG